jgi:hypothetical protein
MTSEQYERWAAENDAQAARVMERSLAAGRAAKPITTWREVACFVDEPTWERILGDLAPKSRAEALRARPCKAFPNPTVECDWPTPARGLHVVDPRKDYL